MAILQTNKQTDIEKRLRLLRQQVYGKESVVGSHNFTNKKYAVSENNSQEGTHTINYQLHTTDISYLYQDLLKIGIFATAAIAIQLILFFLNKNNILNIKLF